MRKIEGFHYRFLGSLNFKHFLKILSCGSVCSPGKASVRIVWVERSGSGQATSVYPGPALLNDPRLTRLHPDTTMSSTRGATLAAARALQLMVIISSDAQTAHGAASGKTRRGRLSYTLAAKRLLKHRPFLSPLGSA